MFTIMRIDSHSHLQRLSENLSGLYSVQDQYILRCAVLEVLQNTLQHSDGRFAIKVSKDYFTIVNLIRDNEHPSSGLALKIYSGISAVSSGKLFFTTLRPAEVGIKEIDHEFCF